MNTQALSTRPPSVWERLVLRSLTNLQSGCLRVNVAGRSMEYGAGQPRVQISVLDERFFKRVCLGGSIGAGESYMDGDWVCSDLVGLMRIMAANIQALDQIDSGTSWLRSLANTVEHAFNRNSLTGSRRNIAQHYDLSNEFFSTFLDERMMYSSAFYTDDKMDLASASTAKLERLCQKLELKPSDHLLEIGTGWGGLAIYAAKHFGAQVTTTTISAEQHAEATRRVMDAGLEDRVTVLMKDYRQLESTYDKVVSVEMVEAVGHQYLDQYFSQCSKLLKPGGLFVLQAITIEDHRYESAAQSVDFIKKHIFPGGFLPSVSRMVRAVADNTRCVLVNLEDLGYDYALTTRAWREKTLQQSDAIRQLGFDDRFIRMWEFYLAYCEGGFLERAISNVQMVFAKQGYTGQPFRA